MLKKSGKKIIVAINKMDTKVAHDNMYNFYELGFEHYIPISAEQNSGIYNLLDEVIADFGDVKDIEYINRYDNNYIVMDKKYLYLFDDKYEEIDKLDVKDIYENKKNYDIVYRDKTIMYMDNFKNKEGIIYRYYDIYTYELIDEIVIGR